VVRFVPKLRVYVFVVVADRELFIYKLLQINFFCSFTVFAAPSTDYCLMQEGDVCVLEDSAVGSSPRPRQWEPAAPPTELALFPRKLSSHFLFFDFCIIFMLDPDPNSDPEPETEAGTIMSPPRQKVAVTAIPAPQHCFYGLRAGQSCPHPPTLPG
jgi:hypothetical protein